MKCLVCQLNVAFVLPHVIDVDLGRAQCLTFFRADSKLYLRELLGQSIITHDWCTSGKASVQKIDCLCLQSLLLICFVKV